MTTNTNTTSTRPLVITAAIPSVLSLAWTAWSIADMVPAPWPIAVAAGIALDIALVAAVALAWMAPSVTRPAQVASWVVAALAAAAIGVHSFEITPALALLAAVPLVAKGLWHLALVAKTAADAAQKQAEDARRKAEQEQKQKQRRLSTNLTEDEEAKVADLKRRAAFTKEQAEAQRELDAATSEAQHRAKLAQIQRQAEEQMAADEATAQIHVRRHELAQQINLAAPVAAAAPAQHQQLPAVPDDASSLAPPQDGQAGFGAGLSQARTNGGQIGRQGGGIAPDLHEGPSAAVAGGGIGDQGGGIGADQHERAPHHAARVAAGRDTRQRVQDEIDYAGVQVSNAELSRLLGIGRTTVRDHRNALREAGHRVYPEAE